MGVDRINRRFEALKAEQRAAFVAYLMAGDPDAETTLEVMRRMPASGVDVIELGMPFTDPMADGPAIQLAAQRALEGGMTLAGTLELARRFREADADTPIILMGYYNPIYAMGVPAFLEKAIASGIDGMIVVDLPPEEDAELCLPAAEKGLAFIRLATPTTNAERLPAVLKNTSGFVYYVSITGITGAAEADAARIAPAVEKVRAAANLPVCVGFGVRTPERAAEVAASADGVVVGTAIVSTMTEANPTEAAPALARSLADGVRSAAK